LFVVHQSPAKTEEPVQIIERKTCPDLGTVVACRHQNVKIHRMRYIPVAIKTWLHLDAGADHARLETTYHFANVRRHMYRIEANAA